MSSPARVIARDAPEGSPQAVFFSLLLAATALPYVVFLGIEQLLPEIAGIARANAVLVLLGGAGHVAASFWFYTDRGMRHFMLEGRSSRYLVVPAAVVALATGIFAFGSDGLRAHALVVFWIWQTHHFTRQNHGILAFASRANASAPSLAERTAITLTGTAAIFAMIPFITPYRGTLLADHGWLLHHVGLGAYACAWVAYAVSLWQRRAEPLGWKAALLLALMLFYLPLFLFDDAFPAVFAYLVAHGLQYLLFMRYVVSPEAERSWGQLAALAGFTLAGGLTIRWLQSGVGLAALTPNDSPLYGFALGIVMWHFLLDAGVWRLSEPFQRGYMSRRFAFLGR